MFLQNNIYVKIIFSFVYKIIQSNILKIVIWIAMHNISWFIWTKEIFFLDIHRIHVITLGF